MRVWPIVGVLTSLLAGHANASPSQTSPSADVILATSPDIVIRSVQRPTRMSLLTADADWARASPDGVHTLVGTSLSSSRLSNRTAGRITLYPGGRAIPLKGADELHTGFSADGKYLVVASSTSVTRAPSSGPIPPSTISIFSMPKAALVHQIEGAEPEWVSPSTIFFRRARQPFRFDVTSGAAVPAGVSQSTLGCGPEDFHPAASCKSSQSTRVMATDPTMTSWLVRDSTRPYALRVLKLASGESRELMSEPAGDYEFIRPIVVSPRHTRMCAWRVTFHPKTAPGPYVPPHTSALQCASLPAGAVQTIFVGHHDPTGVAWLDDDRLLFRNGDWSVIDFRLKTIAGIVGMPDGNSATPLDGGRKLVLTGKGSPVVVDFEQRTQTTFGKGERVYVYPVPGSDRRFVIETSETPNGQRPFFTVDI